VNTYDDGMGENKIDTMNGMFGATIAKISIVEEKEDVSELIMGKGEASEVTQLSCIADKCSSVQDVAKQLDMLWNNFADLNRTMKNCRGIYEYDSHNVTSTIINHCLLSTPFLLEKSKNYWMSKSTKVAQKS
jgi:hypothetical protein